jgi:hypothetical protein
MPKSIRDNLKHSCARAIKHNITSSQYIVELMETFGGSHPKEEEALKTALEFNTATIDALQLFMLETWGIDTDNIHKWF